MERAKDGGATIF